MSHPDYFLLGKILRPHGVKGDVVIYLDSDSLSRYKKMKLIYVEQEGTLKEFDISKVISIKEHEHTAVIHLVGIEDINTAEHYLKLDLYLPMESLPKLRGKKFYFHEIIGFTIIDEKEGEVGIISNVYELPQHPVGEFIRNEKAVLFPLSEIFIQNIDRIEKKIFVTIPEGLIDVYLQ